MGEEKLHMFMNSEHSPSPNPTVNYFFPSEFIAKPCVEFVSIDLRVLQQLGGLDAIPSLA
jgi:hypothetical protein